jgi:hypothetical protein
MLGGYTFPSMRKPLDFYTSAIQQPHSSISWSITYMCTESLVMDIQVIMWIDVNKHGITTEKQNNITVVWFVTFYGNIYLINRISIIIQNMTSGWNVTMSISFSGAYPTDYSCDFILNECRSTIDDND